MLQYILTENDRFSAPELAQMAIEGGCQWISIRQPEMSDEDLRALIAPDIVDMCREAGVFLTVDDRPELARDINIHGVRLSREFFVTHPDQTPARMRDEMGPEAVIGIETADPSALPMLAAADIDFVTLPARFSDDEIKRFVVAVQTSGVQMPVVDQQVASAAEAQKALGLGCAGVAVGNAISRAQDPVQAMRDFLNALGA